MNGRSRHEPVLVREVLELLDVGPGARVADGTVGEGGHAEALLERSAPDGRVLGLDRDPEALQSAARHLARFGDRVKLVQSNFSELGSVLASEGWGPVDAILLDLGMSSLQLDRIGRGFRFQTDARDTVLDMRMGNHGPDAATLLASAPEHELARIFREYGELPGAARLARGIVARREDSPVRSVGDLLDLVEELRIGRGRRHHPATLVFQALRMAVNDEIGELDRVLEDLARCLRPGGRVGVIAYHSLEDRRVKNVLRDLERGCVCPPGLPECRCGREPLVRRVVRRPVRPTEDEIRSNPRARSARLRVAERLPESV